MFNEMLAMGSDGGGGYYKYVLASELALNVAYPINVGFVPTKAMAYFTNDAPTTVGYTFEITNGTITKIYRSVNGSVDAEQTLPSDLFSLTGTTFYLTPKASSYVKNWHFMFVKE